eukprot:2607100-Prymnesium_polylepis.1
MLSWVALFAGKNTTPEVSGLGLGVARSLSATSAAPCGLDYGKTAAPGYEAYVCSASQPYCVGFVAGQGWGVCSATQPSPPSSPSLRPASPPEPPARPPGSPPATPQPAMPPAPPPSPPPPSPPPAPPHSPPPPSPPAPSGPSPSNPPPFPPLAPGQVMVRTVVQEYVVAGYTPE